MSCLAPSVPQPQVLYLQKTNISFDLSLIDIEDFEADLWLISGTGNFYKFRRVQDAVMTSFFQSEAMYGHCSV